MNNENIKDEEVLKNENAENQEQETVEQTTSENESENVNNESENDNESSNSDGELSDLEKKELEYKELHDKYIRLFSEFDNFRKRTAKEKLELTMSAGSDIIKQILPILDDFERAIANNEKSEDLSVVKEGFMLIHSKIKNTLTAKGLKEMNSQGETFNVNIHEALTQIPAPSEDLKGKVVDVIEKGYLLNDKVLRFAKVVVGQ